MRGSTVSFYAVSIGQNLVKLYTVSLPFSLLLKEYHVINRVESPA